MPSSPNASLQLPFDTVVVAGGRSSRLGGAPKAQLSFEGSTLVAHTVAAVRLFGAVVVVGPEDPRLPPDVLRAREDPPFSGPAAAVAAGVIVLDGVSGRHEWTAVLACDMPHVDRALPTLVRAAQDVPPEVDGVMALSDEGRAENLAVLIRSAALSAVLREVPTVDVSVRSVWRHLTLGTVPVPHASTSDVDTWEDVRRFDLH